MKQTHEYLVTWRDELDGKRRRIYQTASGAREHRDVLRMRNRRRLTPTEVRLMRREVGEWEEVTE
jgi:hypothetical protein